MAKRRKTDPFLEEKIFAAMRKKPESTREEIREEVNKSIQGDPIGKYLLQKRIERLKDAGKLFEGFEVLDAAIPPGTHQFIILISTQRSAEAKGETFATTEILADHEEKARYLSAAGKSVSSDRSRSEYDYQKRLVEVIERILKSNLEPFATHIILDSCSVLLGGGGWDVALIVRSHLPTAVHKMVRHLKLLDVVESTSTLEFDYESS